MQYTDEYTLGWGAWAKHFGFKVERNGPWAHYTLPGTWENGWISEVHPAEGVSVASAWLTPDQTLDYTMHIPKPCLWIFCVDCGDIGIVRRGKPVQKVQPFTQLLINSGNPIRLTLPAGVHTCFTSVLIFDSFLETFLSATGISYPIRVQDARQWKPRHVDTPGAMMVMEQIRWGVRGNRLPPPAYLFKAMELLSVFAHQLSKEQYKRERRHYVTWDNEKKLYRVQARIDSDPLNPPSLDDLCALAQMSESKLRIAFKSLYGKTLYAYTRESVMKRAMQMLADDELSIKNIAARCGYENPAKFAAAFKEIHGITPSAFRKGFGL